MMWASRLNIHVLVEVYDVGFTFEYTCISRSYDVGFTFEYTCISRSV